MGEKTILIIAATSSDGCAGALLDSVVAARFKLIPACAVTAVTAQNTCGVVGVHQVPPAEVKKQIDAVFSDLDVAAVKIGMLWSKKTALEVARALGEWGALNVVFDPVMSAQADGSKLVEEGSVDAFRAVAAISDIVTPNMEEIKALSGISVKSEETACRAAWELMELGAQSVMLKSYPWKKGWLADLVFTDEGFALFKKKRIASSSHGGGCLLSTTIACCMGRGMELLDSVSIAEAYVEDAIKKSVKVGRGIRAVNPYVWSTTDQ